MYKRGFSSLIIVLIIGFVLVSGSLVFLYVKDDSSATLPKATTEDKIDSAIANRMRSLGSGSGFSAVNDFRLINIKGNYARGEIVVDGVTKNVHLISVNGEDWVVVEISKDPISCEKAEKMGYPSSMVSDCLYKHPDAEKVEVVLAWSKEKLISVDEIEIIGEVNFGDDPTDGTFELVSENGDSIIIAYDPNDENFNDLSDGDYIVVNVTPSENENGDVVLDLNSTEDVETINDVVENNTEDVIDENNSIIDLEPKTSADGDVTSSVIDNTTNTTDNTTTDTTSNTTNDTSTDTTNTTQDTTQTTLDDEPITEEFDITNLTTETLSEEYYYSLIDRDTSGGVQIISDF